MAAAAALTVLAAAVPAQAAVPAPAATPVPAAVPAPPPGFTLTWSDDFDGAAGTGLPGNNWRYDTGTGFGTGEIEEMTTSTANVFHDGQGNLVLRALHQGSDPRAGWTSGRIQSQSAEFGAEAGGVVRMESVLRQPDVNQSNGAGYWPAFWMLGKGLREGGTWPGVGEVDILENINGRDSVFSALHCGTFPGGPCNESTGITGGEQPCPGCKSGFHSYAAEIDRSTSPEEIRYYLDGRVHTTIRATSVDATTWANAVHHPFFILYDLAIGGGFPDAFGGGPNANTVSGGQLIIDSVSVYNKGPAPGGNTGGGTGGGWRRGHGHGAGQRAERQVHRRAPLELLRRCAPGNVGLQRHRRPAVQRRRRPSAYPEQPLPGRRGAPGRPTAHPSSSPRARPTPPSSSCSAMRATW